jgi:hypothetical protein
LPSVPFSSSLLHVSILVGLFLPIIMNHFIFLSICWLLSICSIIYN